MSSIQDIQRMMRRFNGTSDFTEGYLEKSEEVIHLTEQSLGDVVGDFLSDVAQQIVSSLPPGLTSDGVRFERVANMRVITARGYQMDVIPTLLKVTLSTEDTSGFITAVVDFDDGTYSAVDLKRERERFSIHDSAPVSDLVGLVSRYLRSRVREY